MLRALEALSDSFRGMLVMNSRKQIPASDALLDTLGIRRFTDLSGARDFLFEEGCISFKLPSHFARKGINEIRIQLTADARYDISFSRISRLARVQIAVDRDVSPEEVKGILFQRTGLRIS